MLEPKVLEACLEYTRSLFAPEDGLLRSVRAEIQRRGWPEICVSPEEGRTLQLWLRAVRAARVVEVGTLAGYSAIWIARALPPTGRLITIEREREFAETARGFFDRGGLADRVEVRVGKALHALEALNGEGPFDALFIDADKANYPRYLEWGLRHVRPGGLLLADNAYWSGRVVESEPGDPDVQGIREYNGRAATDPRLLSVILPVRDGLAVSVVLD